MILPVTSAPTNVMAEQEGPTDIRVMWTPSTGADGYIISYSNGSSSDRVTVSGGSAREQLLTGLLNGATYTISIIATSQQQLPSEAVNIEDDIMLGKVYMMVICDCFITTPATTVPPPNMPTVDTETAELGSTSISLSWTVPDDSVVTGSLVMWELASSGGSSARAVRDDGSGSSPLLTDTRYTITGLRSSTSYNITVILINPAGNSSLQITLSTTEGTVNTQSTVYTITTSQLSMGCQLCQNCKKNYMECYIYVRNATVTVKNPPYTYGMFPYTLAAFHILTCTWSSSCIWNAYGRPPLI